MDSSGKWGSNGLTSVNCGGVWGNSSSMLSGSSIWNTGSSGKRSTSDMWPGLEIDSKIDNCRWGSLTSDGSSYRPKNSSPGSNAGASMGPDGDGDPWGRSSGHGSSSSWGSASTSDNKDASGWGSLDPSPVPNAGTESWGFRQRTSSNQSESKSCEWKQCEEVKPAPGLEKDVSSGFHSSDEGGGGGGGRNPLGEHLGEQKSTDQASLFPSEVSSSDLQSIWGRSAPIMSSSHCSSAGSTETIPDAVSQLQEQTSVSGPGNGGAPRDPPLSAEALSREEIIRRAVNSHEGWGKTPIRQDTPWNIDDEPKKPILPNKLEDISLDRSQLAPRDRSGSLSWSQGPELSAMPEKSRTGSGVWGSVVSDNYSLGGLVTDAGSSLVSELGAKGSLSSDKLLSDNTSWPSRPAPKEVEWGAGLGLSENEMGKKDAPWDAAESAGMNKMGAAETGLRGPSLSRSASASTWSSDESESQGWPRSDTAGATTEKGLSIWGNDSGDMQNWKTGFNKPATSLPPEGLFNVPPPQFGGSGFGNLIGPWGNSNKQGPSAGGLSDGGKPQMRVRLLQQLVEMGFKREEAQAALISNNLNMEAVISKLLASQMRGPGLDSDTDHSSATHRLFQGANHASDLAMLSRSDLPPDSAACLMSLLQNSPNSTSGSGQLGGSMSGVGQLRSPATSTIPQVPPNPLAMLSSLSPNMLPSLQQKLMQPGQRGGDGNQAAQVTALQHQLLQQHLLQNVQGAVQAGLIPPQLITVQSLTPTVLVKLQQMMEMYQALQGLTSRYQVLMQENVALVQSRQRPQNLGELELLMTSFKQQIYLTQQQILQELTVVQPPPLPSASAGMDQLLKSFTGLQMKDEALMAAGLMNQWKMGPSGDDPSNQIGSSGSNIQHSVSMLGTQANSFGLDRQWMPAALTSCWSRSSELGATSAGGKTDDAGLSYTSATTADGAMPHVADAVSTSTAMSDENAPAPQLEIAEFVPGKPWQGLAAKTSEDDPHLTPGSAMQSSLVLNELSGGKAAVASSAPPSSVGNVSDVVPPSSSVFAGLSKSSISNANLSSKVSPWSPVDASMTSDPWARNQSYQNRMPFQQQQQQQQQAAGRGSSWSGADRTSNYKPLQPGSPSLPSNWLRIKNISSQVDMRMLEAICEQHGQLECFVPNLLRDSVIVKYVKLDDAQRAQRQLNLCPLAGQPIVAEFLNKFEVFQILQQAPASVHAQLSKPFNVAPTSASTSSPYQLQQGLGRMGPNPSRWNPTAGAPFGAGSAPLGSGTGSWGAAGEDQGFYLPNSKHF